MDADRFHAEVMAELHMKESGYCFSSGTGFGFAPFPSEPIKDTNMPKISEMLPSNYLKQSDFPEDYVVTVRAIERKNIAMDGKPADYKWLATFAEFDKPMVLNSTNIQLMSKACGSDDSDDWIGKQIIVFVDENVSFGGELVGGLRIRKYRQDPAPTPQRRPAPAKAAATSDGPPPGHPANAPDDDYQ